MGCLDDMAAFFWAALLGLLAAIVWLTSFRALTADDLYALALIGDAWADVPFLWILAPANGLFPGLLIAGIGFSAGLDGIAFHVFFAAAFSVLLFIATGYFFRCAGLNKAHIWPAAALSVMLICFASSPSLRWVLFLSGTHAGVLIVALFAFALAARYVERGTPSLLWLLALVMLSTFSDLLTVVQVVLPIVGGMILLGWEQPQLRRTASLVSSFTMLGALVGVGFYFAEGWTGIVSHGTVPPRLTSIIAAARAYVGTLRELTSVFGMMNAGCAIVGRESLSPYGRYCPTALGKSSRWCS